MMQMRTIRREERPAVVGGREGEYFMAEQIPPELRRRGEIVFDVLSHVPLQQPAAIVTGGGRTVAVNAALLALLGGEPDDYLDRDWEAFMPAWPRRDLLFRPGTLVFEERITGAGGTPVWSRVSLGPISRPGEPEPVGYVLFVSKPDLEAVDQDEVCRLRKGVDLLAGVQTDYVVEVDRDGSMSFVSPSFCRAVGAREAELVGRPFLSRVCVDDRAGAAEALAEARKAPFCGEMRARLAADRCTEVVWQMEAVIGDGVTALDLVGRVQAPA